MLGPPHFQTVYFLYHHIRQMLLILLVDCAVLGSDTCSPLGGYQRQQASHLLACNLCRNSKQHPVNLYHCENLVSRQFSRSLWFIFIHICYSVVTSFYISHMFGSPCTYIIHFIFIFGILLFVLCEVCLEILDFVPVQIKYRLLLKLKCCLCKVLLFEVL